MVASTVHSSAQADNRGPQSATALHDLFVDTEPSPDDLRNAIAFLEDRVTEIRASETPPGWTGLSKLERLRDRLDTSLFKAELQERGFPAGLSETQLTVLEAMDYGHEHGTNGTIATLVKATRFAAGAVSTATSALEAGGLIQHWKARQVTSGEGYFSLTDFGRRAQSQLAVAGSSLQ
jgi:DNA-binding MarR family transcriptional regulator